MAGGATMRGYLIVNNSSSSPIESWDNGCSPKFGVYLTSSAVPGSIAFRMDCSTEPLTFPRGETRLPVTVVAGYPTCAQGASNNPQVPVCPPTGMAPLPPDNYLATLGGSIPGMQTPTPVPIHVTSPTDTTTPPPPVPETVTVQGLTFTLPPQLKYRSDGFTSSGEGIDEFYANFPLGPACNPGCGISSFMPLPAGGVVVGIGVLSGVGISGANPDDPPPNTSVAGHAAVLTTDTSGQCGDEAIDVRIPNPSGNDIIIRACLGGPDLTNGEQAFRTLLASAKTSGS